MFVRPGPLANSICESTRFHSNPNRSLSMPDPATKPPSYWHSIVVPAAVGLEAFFWRLAWFTVVVAMLYCCCFKHRLAAQGDHLEDRTSPAVHDQTVSQQPANERRGR